METDKAVNVVLSSVKKSNLNFYIQESPFSLFINIRKTFIKNKEGNILCPPTSDTTTDDTINKQKQEVAKLEKENFIILSRSLCLSLITSLFVSLLIPRINLVSSSGNFGNLNRQTGISINSGPFKDPSSLP